MSTTDNTDQTLEQREAERIETLREIEPELREVAAADVPYSEVAQRLLDTLEEADQ